MLGLFIMLVLWVAVGVFSSHKPTGPEKAVDMVEPGAASTKKKRPVTEESPTPPHHAHVEYGVLPERMSRAEVSHLHGVVPRHTGPMGYDHPDIHLDEEGVMKTPYGNYAMGETWVHVIGSQDGRLLVSVAASDHKTLHIMQRDTMNEVDGYQPWKKVTLLDDISNMTFMLGSYLLYVRSVQGTDRVIRVPENVVDKDSVPEIISEASFKSDPVGIEYRSAENTVYVYHDD